MKLQQLTLKLLGIGFLVGIAACTTTFDGNKVDYKSQSKQGLGLDVPPDLSQISRDSRAAVPKGGAISASGLQGGQAAQQELASPNRVSVNALADVRVQRDGGQRWLVVERSADVLWPDIKAFWTDHGFTLALDQPNLGIMETEWNENRAKLPQDGIRRLIGKVIDGLYSTNERDKFRTRLERTASGGTEIYISHKGMAEDFTTSQREQLKWKNRPTDPELEVEFLKRLMVRLSGASVAAAGQALAPALNAATGTVAAVQRQRAIVVYEAGGVSMGMTDPLEQAWRRIGLSLDRTNFTVEDRDRSKGVYFVRYVQPNVDKNPPGFFARMLGAKVPESLQKYQILVTATGSQTTVVRVANTQGQVIHTPEAQNILKVLAEDLQ